MARLIYALNQSLDGYVDHDSFGPDAGLFQHFIEDMRGLSAAIYGRRMYEVMRYWDDEQPGWGPAERDYAEAWRACPKWVVSRTLQTVGPNADLIADDVEARLRRLKAETDGDMEIAGPEIAASMAGLIDEYRLYVHPVVVGAGKRFFAGARPPLRLAACDPMSGGVVRLTYVPA